MSIVDEATSRHKFPSDSSGIEYRSDGESKVATQGKLISVPAKTFNPEEPFFERGDMMSIVAALVDSLILGISLVLTLVWQSGIHNKPPVAPTLSSTWSPAGSNVSTSAASVPIPVSRNETVNVCEAFVTTTFNNGTTHAVEYRGNCTSMRALVANTHSSIHWLPSRSYNFATNGK